MIQIIQGSIFDSKCDMLIIPCDSGGGVTQSVFNNLYEHRLPTSIGRIPYGEVNFQEVKFAFASILGYAASVNARNTKADAEAIQKIGNEIVRYSTQNQIRCVNIPLLGSGAGGLTARESFEALRKAFSDQDDVTFNIFCFTREAYQNLSVVQQQRNEAQEHHPRVFISYTGVDNDNRLWVKELATQLRSSGVDARLDVFHLKPGFDLPQWMTNEVIMADKVLLICDRHYMEKADFRKGGVGWETMIIQGDMLSQGDNKQKYVAIIREERADQALPIYMRSKFAFNWSKSASIDPENFKELLMCIYDCDDEPSLGSIPSFVKARAKRSKG